MIAQRRDSGATREDLLQALLDERDEHGDPLGDQEIHDQVVSILVAGTETAASTMSWAFHLLSRHPKQEQRLHRELAPVAADHPINYTDLRSLPHLTNVITEALRIHPAGWIFTRRSVRETTLGDYRIPAGADIIYSPYALHRDPRHFERPAEFDPDRWTRERAAGIPRFAMIPFGAGNRKCPGDGYGMAEASLVVAAIASRWRLAPTPRTNADPQPHVLMSPKRLEMRVLPLA
jgi:epi-isozizaene 5-monooxygenase